ncbi:hypothetical protein [Ruminiclostridium cellobioparum]|uniref:hypothetical protein n=1 Tax=Ruminiclostridium cellobioparum TaxID=29355 RepID=UPI0028B22729|nr:hypothetical protein [Ruminiclostridium cellobioparum]
MQNLPSSAVYSDDTLTIFITLMESKEYPPPLNQYHIFEFVLKLKQKDIAIPIDDFTFYLMCGNRIYNSIAPKVDKDIYKYIEASDSYNQFFGIPTLGFREEQTLLVLFEKTPEVYYKEPQIIIYYKPYQRLIPISLTY